MKTRTMLLLAALCVFAVSCFAADDANVGSWKLNEAKSKIPAGASKNTSVVYTAEGDSYKCVVEAVDGSGQPLHNEWTGKFDGKDYPVTGDQMADSRAIKKVSDRRYDLVEKKDSKPIRTGTITLSADGKMRTVSVSGKDANGKPVKTTFVYDKE